MRSLVFWLAGYQLAIDADSLGKMARNEYRNLLHFARRDPRNEGPLRELRKILQENVGAAEKALTAAQTNYTENWRHVDRRSRTPKSIETTRRNVTLHNAVKRAKADLSTAKAIWKIFIETE